MLYSMYFVVVMLSFQLLTKHSSAALPCKQFVNKSLTHYTCTHIVSLAIINGLFLLVFTLLGLKRTIDSARPAPLPMNEFITIYWNSYTNWNSFVNIS